MKPTPRNKLIPTIQLTTQVEFDFQQIVALNRLVLGSRELTDDEALNLWQALNPWVREFLHSNPRDVFSSLRYAALAALLAKPEPKPPYPIELINEVRSDIEIDNPNCICS